MNRISKNYVRKYDSIFEKNLCVTYYITNRYTELYSHHFGLECIPPSDLIQDQATQNSPNRPLLKGYLDRPFLILACKDLGLEVYKTQAYRLLHGT